VVGEEHRSASTLEKFRNFCCEEKNLSLGQRSSEKRRPAAQTQRSIDEQEEHDGWP